MIPVSHPFCFLRVFLWKSLSFDFNAYVYKYIHLNSKIASQFSLQFFSIYCKMSPLAFPESFIRDFVIIQLQLALQILSIYK